MKQLIYSIRFEGRATPENESPNILKASTKGQSCAIRTVVGPNGLDGKIEPISGSEAAFESEVTLTDESSFQESGTIEFGDGNVISFSTVGAGHLQECPDPKLKHGSVVWTVDEGTGQFEGAHGLITSNFFITDEGQVTDNHLGILFIR